MKNEERERIDHVGVMEHVFNRIDPILRLLFTIQHRIQHVASTQKETDPSLTLILLKKQFDLLDELLSIVNELVNDKFLKEVALSVSLSGMLKYLSVPLLVTLHTSTIDWDLSKKECESNCLLRSAKFKCINVVTRLLHVLAKSIRRKRSSFEPTNDKNSRIWMHFVVRCVALLPSGQQFSNNLQKRTLLDRGESTLHELLDAITVLLPFCPSEPLVQFWEGGLVMRLADTCVAIMAPSPSSSTNSKSLTVPTTNGRDSKTISLLSQRVAATTLLAILTQSSLSPVSCRLWRYAFPGCFAGMFRSVLPLLRVQSVHPVQSRNLASTILQCLTTLFHGTLARTFSLSKQSLNFSPITADYAASMLQNIAQEANIRSLERNEHPARQSLPIVHVKKSLEHQNPALHEESEMVFLEQVKKRVAAPLLVLVPLLVKSAESNLRPLMREVALLLRVLWINRECFANDSLTMAIYESCIILEVRAKEINEVDGLEIYRTVLNGSSTNDFVSATNVSKLILEIGSLVKSRDQSSLQNKLRLISPVVSHLQKAGIKTLRASFTTSEEAIALQSCLVSLFEVKLSTWKTENPSERQLIQVINLDSSKQRFQASHPSPGGVKYNWLEPDSFQLAVQMVQNVGRALGISTCYLIIDSIMARLYQSLLGQEKERLQSQSQVQWLHEWLGAFEVVKQLLYCTSHKKKEKLFEDVCRSILHVLVSPSLVNLPHCKEKDLSEQSECSGNLLILSDVSATALQGNRLAVHLTVKLIGEIADLQGIRFSRLLPVCFFQIIEKAASDVHIRDVAWSTLERIVAACDYGNLECLVLDNIDSVMGSMTAKLRIPGGRAVSGIVDFDAHVIDVMLTAMFLLQTLTPQNESPQYTLDRRKGSILIEIVKELMSRFDHSNTRIISSTEIVFCFLGLFNVAFLYLRSGCKVSDKNPAFGENHVSKMPWLALLNPFKLQFDSPETGAICNQNRQGQTAEETNDSGSEIDSDVDHDTLVDNTHFVAQVLLRCCYCLSSSSLLVQIKAIETISSGFSYLGWVANHVKQREDELNGPSTAILRVVHSTWTSLVGRLEAKTNTVTTFLGGRHTSAVVHLYNPLPCQQQLSLNLGEHRLFLSKLYGLFAVMVECAGDFMTIRLRESVWPCVGRTFSAFLLRIQINAFDRQRHHLHSSTGMVFNHHVPYPRLAESETGLLMSLLEFLRRVYAIEDVGRALSSLIPATGTLLLPFLGDSDTLVSQKCTAALKGMLRIDCDALQRPLSDLCGRSLPPFPLLCERPRSAGTLVVKPSHSHSHSHSNPKTINLLQPFSVTDQRMAEAAVNLLDFMDSLEEQILQ